MHDEGENERWRCTTVGCNPVLMGVTAGRIHMLEENHSVAKWPVRSKAGEKKAKARSRNGYYDKYNIGEKASHRRPHKRFS